MDLNQALIIAGLALDIIGVAFLFITGTAPKVEMEILVRSMENVIGGDVPEGTEAARRRIDRNNLLGKSALLALLIGFVLQIIGQLV